MLKLFIVVSGCRGAERLSGETDLRDDMAFEVVDPLIAKGEAEDGWERRGTLLGGGLGRRRMDSSAT